MRFYVSSLAGEARIGGENASIQAEDAFVLPKEDSKMLGFVIGSVCVIALIKAVRRRRRRGGHFGRPWHGYGGGRRSRIGWGLRSLLQRLDTTPVQEKALFSALEGLRDDRRLVREELDQTRVDLARVVRGGLVDDAAFEESFARHDRLLAQVRVAAVEFVKQAVEVLDERQRKILADSLEGGGLFGRGQVVRGGVWA